MHTPNIIHLSVDSLQYHLFSTALSEISDLTDSVQFTNAVAPAPYTSSSVPALAAGVYADSLSSVRLPNDGSITTLAEHLTNTGYQSGLWSDNYIFGKEYGYDRGFCGGNQGEKTTKKKISQAIQDSLISPLFGGFEWIYFNLFQRFQSTVADDATFYSSAENLHSDALRWIRDTSQPFFCWIHYMDTHHPYNPPPEYLDDEIFERFQSRSELAQFTRNSIKSGGKHLSDSELSDVTAVYNACCEYLHDSIVEFISTLKSAGQFDPSEDIFVLTADHGECLSPQKYSMMGHTPPAFFEEILHVPLAISRPDWDQTVVDDQVSLIDIFPTVLDAANISIPKNIDGNACSSPEKMGREHTRAVAKSGNKTYHSLRRDDGWKLSGSVRNGVDEMILSRYNVDTSSDEEIVYTTTDGQAPNDTECANVFRELQILRQSEGFIQDGSMGFEHSKIKEEHLKDLGYL